MTTSVLKVNKKNFVAHLGKSKLNIFHLGFLCYQNTLQGLESWDSCSQEKAENKVEEAKFNFNSKADKPQYFVDLPSDAKLEDKNRSVVYKSKDTFSGVTDDSNFEALEPFGVILCYGRKCFVETDLERIEQIRRNEEIEGIKKGLVHIGFDGVVDGDYEGNAERYKNHLSRMDAEKGCMVTRGYYL